MANMDGLLRSLETLRDALSDTIVELGKYAQGEPEEAPQEAVKSPPTFDDIMKAGFNLALPSAPVVSNPPPQGSMDAFAAPEVVIQRVYSDTDSVKPYSVVLEGGEAVRCSCLARGACKHMYRAEVESTGTLLAARDELIEKGRVVSVNAFNDHYDKVKRQVGRNAATALAIRAAFGVEHRLAHLPQHPAKDYKALQKYLVSSRQSAPASASEALSA